MNNYKHLKNVLNFNIRKLTNLSFPFRESPDSDFTRNRKLDFDYEKCCLYGNKYLIRVKNIYSKKQYNKIFWSFPRWRI